MEVRLRNLILSLSLVLSALAVASTDREFDADSVHLVDVLSHCLPQYEEAMKDADHVAKIEYLAPRPAVRGESVEIYRLTLSTHGLPPGPPPQVVSIFEITRKSSPPPPGLQDGAPRVHYTCTNNRQ